MKITKTLSAVLTLAALNACSQPEQQSTQQQTKPNVIIIMTDDQGYGDVGSYGAQGYSTPNLDQMAAEGLRFTDYYAAQAVCTSSRAGLLTGSYPNRIGVHGAFFPGDGQGLHHDEVTIAEMLKEQGYATATYGKWHLGDDELFMPHNHGFDDFFGIPYSNDMWPLHPEQGTKFDFPPLPLIDNGKVIEHLTDQSNLTKQLTERSVQFINDNKDKPFFIYLAHPQPHVPLYVSDDFKGKSELGLYGDVIMELDWSVGEILKSLKTNGIDDNTLVIFTSDNGPWLNYGSHAGSSGPLREGKSTALEGGQREPFIARFPGKFAEGKDISTPIMAIDLLPTIAHITGANLPMRKIDGVNAWPIFTGETTKPVQEAYFFYYKVNELHGVRWGDWKMYFPHSYYSLNGKPTNTDGTPVKYDYNEFTKIELYNLRGDIGETTDVAAKHPQVVAKIKQLAEKMRAELGDSLQGKAKGAGTRELGRVPGTNSGPQE
ncbi:sulfatase [Paraferrimonas sp. SM1919]|uniref:sulfatase family protein n=1 Tax=Paraferrimonas sp. SM1919 TaxID=2662263 RepID=UPI0013D51BAA|nr:sulfatase [Paraferrimonas sp. SM1919]